MSVIISNGRYLIAGVKDKLLRFTPDGIPGSNGNVVLDCQFEHELISKAIPLTKDPTGRERTEQHNGYSHYQAYAMAFANDGDLVALCTSAKTILLVRTSGKEMTLLRAFRVPKRMTAVKFDPSDKFLIVADGLGTVTKYEVSPSKPGNSESAPDVDSAEEDDDPDETFGFEGELVTSCVSPIMDLAFSRDGKFLFIADRDEKIRVHRWPQTYVCEAYCLGHEQYVSSIATAIIDGRELLVSASGDATVRMWDPFTGDEVGMCKLQTIVRDDHGLEASKLRILEKDGVSYAAVSYKEIPTIEIFKLNAPPLGIESVVPFTILPEGEKETTMDTVFQDIHDFAFIGDHCYPVNKGGLTVFQVMVKDEFERYISVPEEIKQSFDSVKPQIGNLFKGGRYAVKLKEFQDRKNDIMQHHFKRQFKRLRLKLARFEDRDTDTGSEGLRFSPDSDYDKKRTDRNKTPEPEEVIAEKERARKQRLAAKCDKIRYNRHVAYIQWRHFGGVTYDEEKDMLFRRIGMPLPDRPQREFHASWLRKKRQATSRGGEPKKKHKAAPAEVQQADEPMAADDDVTPRASPEP